jgi:hypothetical protein
LAVGGAEAGLIRPKAGELPPGRGKCLHFSAGRLKWRSQADSDATAALERYAFLCSWRAAAGSRLDVRRLDAGGSAFGDDPGDGHHRGHHQERQAVGAQPSTYLAARGPQARSGTKIAEPTESLADRRAERRKERSAPAPMNVGWLAWSAGFHKDWSLPKFLIDRVAANKNIMLWLKSQ